MNSLIQVLKEIILKSGDIALMTQKSGLVVELKKDKSPVSNADKQISLYIYNALKVLTPEIAIICEERPFVEVHNNTFWLIDPIDGTKSYIQGKDTYTINIGLIDNGSPVIGLIYIPAIAKLYYTNSNGQLTVEEHSREVTPHYLSSAKREKIGYDAIVSTNGINRDEQAFLEKYPIDKVCAIASSIKLCLVAEGVADIYPKFGPTMEWDLAAGHALIKASGGNIIDHAGREIQYNKKRFSNGNFYACSRRWIQNNCMP